MAKIAKARRAAGGSRPRTHTIRQAVERHGECLNVIVAGAQATTIDGAALVTVGGAEIVAVGAVQSLTVGASQTTEVGDKPLGDGRRSETVGLRVRVSPSSWRLLVSW
jgi:hypothetical protein